MDGLKDVILQYAGELYDYIHQTNTLALLVLDEKLRISLYNKCFSTLISSGEDISGKPVFSFLLPESHEFLPLSDSTTDMSAWLIFKSLESSSVPLQCHIFKIDKDKHLILGGHLNLTNEHILQKMSVMFNEMANMTRDLHRKNRELKEAHSKIKTLSGIIPICMHCKGIRDDKGYWNHLEQYITEHSDAQLSHGICDKCMKKHYPNIDLKPK